MTQQESIELGLGRSISADCEMFDPLQDSQWDRLVARHPKSSVFHTISWLDALRRTYGYTAFVLTKSPLNGEISNGVLVGRVHSWITGKRFVSLPFSDHCEPLQNDSLQWQDLFVAVERVLLAEKIQYLEIRSSSVPVNAAPLFCSSHQFCQHHLDLTPDLETVFRNFHKDSTQRKIRRAEKENLVYEEGSTPALLNAFYDLMIMTRRRHLLPPQPKRWFVNLAKCFGDALKIRITYKDKSPTAAIVTIEHKDTLVYKYGCSNPEFNNLGGTQMLFWRSIGEAKSKGLTEFDFGRTEWDNSGLLTFKDRWGSTRSTLTYSRFMLAPNSRHCYGKPGVSDWKSRLLRRAIAYLPRPVLQFSGEVLYPHVG